MIKVRRVVIDILVGVVLAFVAYLLFEAACTPFLSGFLFLIIYLIIFLMQVLYYYLTTYYWRDWTVFSFVLNWVLFYFEHVWLEKHSRISLFTASDLLMPTLYAGLFWAGNKIVIDLILGLFDRIPKRKQSNIEALLGIGKLRN